MKQSLLNVVFRPIKCLFSIVPAMILLCSVVATIVALPTAPAQAITNAHSAPKSQEFYKSDGALLATIPSVGTIFICSVVEITPHLALTASHCITSIPSGTPIYVAFGTSIACGGESTSASLSIPGSCNSTVAKTQVTAFVPSGAGKSSYANDIALLQSKTGAALGGSNFPKDPISRLSSSSRYYKTVPVYGWSSGGTTITQAYAPTVFSKYATFASVSTSTIFLQEKVVTTSPIPAICNGDSGGANYVSTNGGTKFYLAALTSTGPTSNTTSCTWPNLATPINLPSVQSFLAGLKTSFRTELTTWLNAKGVSAHD